MSTQLQYGLLGAAVFLVGTAYAQTWIVDMPDKRPLGPAFLKNFGKSAVVLAFFGLIAFCIAKVIDP